MAYVAIALDTQVFKYNAFDFDGGVLNQLRTLRHYDIKVIVPEMVYHESLKHLAIDIQTALSKFHSGLKAARLHGILLKDGPELIEATPEGISQKRLDQYLEDLNVTILPNKTVSLEDVVQLYTRAAPPFALSGEKKSEFPDAISLLGLERWAKESGGTILAISGDKDWQDFAAHSEYIDVVPDVPTALNEFWAKSDAVRLLANHFVNLIESRSPFLLDQMTHEINHALELRNFRGLTKSSFVIDESSPTVELLDFALKDTEHVDLLSHDEDDHLFTISVPAVLWVHAQSWFYFRTGQEKNTLFSSSLAEKSFEMDVLLMVAVAYCGQEILEVIHVEILTAPTVIQFNEDTSRSPVWGDQNSLF